MAGPYHATDSRSIVKADRFGGTGRRDIGLPGIVAVACESATGAVARPGAAERSLFPGAWGCGYKVGRADAPLAQLDRATAF